MKRVPYGYLTVSICWMWVYNQFIYERFGLKSRYMFRFLVDLRNEVESELCYENMKSSKGNVEDE